MPNLHISSSLVAAIVATALTATTAAADTVYVLDRQNQLHVVDAGTCAVRNQHTFGYRLEGLAYDRANDLLYVHDYDVSGTVYRYDPASGGRRVVASFSGLVIDLAVSPTGHEVYALVAIGTTTRLAIYDVARDYIRAELPVRTSAPYRFLRILPDGSRLIGFDERGFITVFDPVSETSEMSRELVWPDTSDISMDPQQRHLATVAAQGLYWGLYIWPSQPLRWLLDGGWVSAVGELDAPMGIVHSPDGQSMYVTTADDEVVVYRCPDMQCLYQKRLDPPGRGIRVGRRPTVIDVTPDGNFLWVGNADDATVTKVNAHDRNGRACLDLGSPAIDIEIGR